MNVLSRARRAAKLTQTELAVRAGLSRSTINHLEMGLKHATTTTLTLLEEALVLPEGALDEIRDTTAIERGRKGAAARLRNAAKRAKGQQETTRISPDVRESYIEED